MVVRGDERSSDLSKISELSMSIDSGTGSGLSLHSSQSISVDFSPSLIRDAGVFTDSLLLLLDSFSNIVGDLFLEGSLATGADGLILDFSLDTSA